ncbi:DUF6074 family protein [Pannonibacter tanglangensis]|uniref:DUF6074 family protein n=1 Tax=Pannonibacter tanglangensis TaxID=2750084 RepID=UPI0037448517
MSETDSQFHFWNLLGSTSCTKEASHGATSCMPPSATSGTIFYIYGGGGRRRRRPSVTGPGEIVQFLPSRCLRRIDDVAQKLGTKRTQRHRDFYRSQVTAGLRNSLRHSKLRSDVVEQMIRFFWNAVHRRSIRILSDGTRPSAHRSTPGR